jgi:hypothetical protein
LAADEILSFYHILSEYLPGRTEEIHEEPHLGQLQSQMRCQGISEMQVYSATATPTRFIFTAVKIHVKKKFNRFFHQGPPYNLSLPPQCTIVS